MAKFKKPKTVIKPVDRRPFSLLIYGNPGVGKTDLAAHFPDPHFIINEDEGILDLMDTGIAPDTVTHESVTTYPELRDHLDNIGKVGCKTIILDNLGSFETMVFKYHCATYFENDWSKSGFYSFQQGPKNAAKTDWKDLIDLLEQVRKSGINVVILAHSRIKPFVNPEGPDYDRYEIDCDKAIVAQTMQWAQSVIFYSFNVTVKGEGSSKNKADNGYRSLNTVWQPTADAKNRWNLPPNIDAGYSGEEAYNNLMNAIKKSRK